MTDHSSWKLALIEGILFILFGMAAVAMPGIVTFSIDLLIGWFFMIGGLVQFIRGIQSRHEPGFWGTLVTSIIFIISGFFLVNRPLIGIMSLTLILAMFFTAVGITKIILSIQLHAYARWQGLLFSGIISLVFAVVIWASLPEAAFWLIGTLVGVDLVFFGFSLILVALENRHTRHLPH